MFLRICRLWKSVLRLPGKSRMHLTLRNGEKLPTVTKQSIPLEAYFIHPDISRGLQGLDPRWREAVRRERSPKHTAFRHPPSSCLRWCRSLGVEITSLAAVRVLPVACEEQISCESPDGTKRVRNGGMCAALPSAFCAATKLNGAHTRGEIKAFNGWCHADLKPAALDGATCSLTTENC